MAKGLEDTALYRHNRLVALNDVGERPDRFHRPVAAFHAANIERARHFPHGLLATSTHDSKRGEDTRCRLLALTGNAEDWTTLVPEWVEQLARDGAPAIDPDDAYTCFQLLVGAWPASGAAEGLADRLVGAMRKSLREARLRSSWIAPDTAYEARVEAFVRAALRPEGAMFASFLAFAERIGRAGAMAGLVETALKLTVPGVPDIYQGAELWEQSLVDPDNRRPVDFARRERLLAASAGEPLAALAAHWQDGAVKQALIARLLAVRAAHPRLFSEGSYEPVEADETVAAFERRKGADALFVAVHLFPWRVEASPAPAVPAGEWRDLLRQGWPEAGPAGFDELPIVVLGRFG
jgi:(1->4)-alpha-D-glucan 1-alpha-D-glucosylmutase